MTTTPWKPMSTDHVMIVEGKPREPWTSTADKVRAAEARLRDARRTQLAHLDQMAARLADLEHPATPKPEPARPDPLEVRDRPQAQDPGWVIDGWRADGWQS